MLALWQLGCQVFNVPRYILPTPGEIARHVLAEWRPLLWDTAATAEAAGAGFVIANVFSALVAVLLSYVPWLAGSVYPWAIALKATPIVALAPISVIWFGYGLASKIVLASVVAFFPLLVSGMAGLRSTPQEVIDLFRSWGATEWQILLRAHIPYALPHVMAGLKVSTTMSVVGAIVAEMSGGERGLGVRLLVSMYEIDTPRLFGAIFAASSLGVALFVLIAQIEARLLKSMGVSEVS